MSASATISGTKRRGIMLSLLTAAALTVAGVPTAPSATAAAAVEIDYANNNEGEAWNTFEARTGNTYSQAAFEAGGDVLYIADEEHDSMRVAVYWRLVDGSRHGLCINTQGTGQYPGPPGTYDGAFFACDKNMIEGKRIEIRSGRCDGSDYSCERVFQYQNWTAWDTATT